MDEISDKTGLFVAAYEHNWDITSVISDLKTLQPLKGSTQTDNSIILYHPETNTIVKLNQDPDDDDDFKNEVAQFAEINKLRDTCSNILVSVPFVIPEEYRTGLLEGHEIALLSPYCKLGDVGSWKSKFMPKGFPEDDMIRIAQQTFCVVKTGLEHSLINIDSHPGNWYVVLDANGKHCFLAADWGRVRTPGEAFNPDECYGIYVCSCGCPPISAMLNHWDARVPLFQAAQLLMMLMSNESTCLFDDFLVHTEEGTDNWVNYCQNTNRDGCIYPPERFEFKCNFQKAIWLTFYVPEAAVFMERWEEFERLLFEKDATCKSVFNGMEYFVKAHREDAAETRLAKRARTK